MRGVPQPSEADLKALQLRAQALILQRQREGTWKGATQAHVAYQGKPVEWIVEKLGIPENTIRWSLNPEYQACHCPRCVAAGNEGKPHIWDGDQDPLVIGLNEVAQGHSIAVSSGTATGKTHTLGACLTLYVLACYERSIVLSLAPKQEQLLLNLWREIGSMIGRFKQHFPNALLLTGKLRMLDAEGEQEIWAATAFSAGVGAQEEVAQRLAGFHRPRMLWLIEDMPGVDNALVNTVVNTAVSRWNPICGLGNPDFTHDTLGQFSKRPWVKAIRISAYDHPNVVCGRELVPGAVIQESIDRRLVDAHNNENDPIYISRVRGVAPAQSEHALIKWEWCEAAAARYNDPKFREGDLALGVDPSDTPTGDEAAIAFWQGRCVTKIKTWHPQNAGDVADEVILAARDRDHPVDARRIGVDGIGIGAVVTNLCRRAGVRVRAVGGSSRPLPLVESPELARGGTPPDSNDPNVPKLRATIESEQWDNERSHGYWVMAKDLEFGEVALPDRKSLFEELCAHTYELVGGKIRVVAKSEVRKIVGRSPNESDSVVYGNLVRRRSPVVKPQKAEPPSRNVDTNLERLLSRMEKRRRMEERHNRRRFRKGAA